MMYTPGGTQCAITETAPTHRSQDRSFRMNWDFKDRVAIITGDQRRHRRATAELLARTVPMSSSRAGEEKLEATRAGIAGPGRRGGSVHRLDVADADAFAALVADVAGRRGRLDMWSTMRCRFTMPLEKLKLEHWRKDFAVNSEAVFVEPRRQWPS